MPYCPIGYTRSARRITDARSDASHYATCVGSHRLSKASSEEAKKAEAELSSPNASCASQRECAGALPGQVRKTGSYSRPVRRPVPAQISRERRAAPAMTEQPRARVSSPCGPLPSCGVSKSRDGMVSHPATAQKVSQRFDGQLAPGNEGWRCFACGGPCRAI